MRYVDFFYIIYFTLIIWWNLEKFTSFFDNLITELFHHYRKHLNSYCNYASENTSIKSLDMGLFMFMLHVWIVFQLHKLVKVISEYARAYS